MLASQTPNADTGRFLKFLLHFGFLVSGTATVLIGQVLPILSSRLSLDDTQAGYFFIAQFSGSLAGTFLTQPFVRRFGFGGATALGFSAMLAGVLGLNFDSLTLCLAAFVVNGFGIGLTLPSINMLTVELNPLKVTPALNFLNFFWGVGAIFCKPFVDFFSTPTSIFQPTLLLAALLSTIGLMIALTARKGKLEESPPVPDENENEPPIWTTSIAWLIAFFNFIHVGFESGMVGWITTYAVRLPNQEGNIEWLSPTFAYFLFFVAGRLIAPLYSHLLSENKMLLLSLSIMTLGVLILVRADTFGVLVVGASIAGLGTSSIFPTNMARFTKTFGATATRRATPLFISGTLGAALTTWLIGYVSTNYQNLRSGMFVLLGSCLLLICLQVFLLSLSLNNVTKGRNF
ncbi:MAG TPA: MFS transporter [Pyrinomonadaceae bacterium]|jgi:fucose permease